VSTVPPVLQNFIGGSYVDPADGRTSPVVDPSTGEAYTLAPISSAADVDAAMTAAARGFEAWRDSTPAERQRAMLRIADAVEARADELIAAECRNTGKPVEATRQEEIHVMSYLG
jgi:betaine-aldehyde dehydrogenase